MSNTFEYTTQAIDTSVLSIFDITKEGKVVSADKWTELWNIMFTHINAIDAYCLSIDDIRLNWEASEESLNKTVEEFKVKYAALNNSFVHYGEEAPTNEHIKLWVKPVTSPDESLTVTHKQLTESLSALETEMINVVAGKVDKFTEIETVLEVDLMQAYALQNANVCITETFLAKTDITSIKYRYKNSNGTITQMVYTDIKILQGTNITVLYTKGAWQTGQTAYNCRAKITTDRAWIIPTASSTYGSELRVESGYIAASIDLDTQTGNAQGSLKQTFYKYIDTVDQTYSANSSNAQSGVALAAVFNGIAKTFKGTTLTGAAMTVAMSNAELKAAKVGDFYLNTTKYSLYIYTRNVMVYNNGLGEQYQEWVRILPQDIVKVSSVTLQAGAWVGAESPYYQTVTLSGITANSKIDLNPTVEQLNIFHNKDLAFVVVNNSGTVKVHCIGQKPTEDYTMQVTITEVALNG